MTPVPWDEARAAAYRAGADAARAAVETPLAEADGLTLAAPLVTLTDLPAFPTSSVDGWAVRGPAPWRVVGRVLAGDQAAPLADDGTCVEIATGAMVPGGTEHVLRVEESTLDGELVTGEPRPNPEWRVPGDEASRGEELLPAGTPVTPGVIGLAASCGYDAVPARPAPRAALIVFGDELLTSGPPGAGRVRDSLGPQLPGWLRRLGATVDTMVGPVKDTLDAHVEAIRTAFESGADLVCTTGGTMHGPVDHLHPALAELGASYVVNTVAVRPGFPMLLAALPGGKFLAGLPGNPQSAVVALMSLVAPLLAGLQGRASAATRTVTLGAPIPGRGSYTHLALVRLEDGLAYPVGHVASSMLRGLSRSAGFAVVAPGTNGDKGATLPLVPLPMMDGERP
ncbi:molybdopterin molybdotransferase MoeA [Planosporangium mesophilum]|uniref:Molybdopterin molybdenumtransferase n=1 Tax=Planosporangium mesophilum TaxID=689768 RepID=A0A8J3T9G2_9ACTN|nr:molybdopterin molybdotransferase MoeA [Planosporangium mesophilum]NJC82263.1 molybdopterin molybdotransferase MoeA [Planosporangium mesophilum]GII22313.1 molybdopterin molybdenumtransferase MoeA [Planosporangium mesophilum]